MHHPLTRLRSLQYPTVSACGAYGDRPAHYRVGSDVKRGADHLPSPDAQRIRGLKIAAGKPVPDRQVGDDDKWIVWRPLEGGYSAEKRVEERDVSCNVLP